MNTVKSLESSTASLYQLGDLTVDTAAVRVARGETVIPLQKLSFDLLVALIEAAPAVATTDYLLQRVWPGLVVGFETITQRVALLRAALGDDPKQARYIAVVRGRGYRLTVSVERLSFIPPPVGALERVPNAGPTTPAASRAAESPLTLGGDAGRRFAWKRGLWRFLPVAVVGTLLLLFAGWHADHRAAMPSQEIADPPARIPSFNPPSASIAVLPFVDMSAAKDEEYFADGLTEEVINQLARVADFKVMARTTSFFYKGKQVTVSEIGRSVNVAYVLEGSVRKAGQFLRITVQLIRCDDGYHVWSNTYNKTHDDVLQIEDEIASSVAGMLYQTIHPSDLQLAEGAQPARATQDRDRDGGTSNANAYDLFLRGMKAYDGPEDGPANYETAIEDFNQAIRLDPHYALAHTRKATALLRLLIVADSGNLAIRRQNHQQARNEAIRAIDFAPDLGEAHLALALTYDFGEVDLAASARECSLAAALSPGSAWVLRNCGLIAAEIGHFGYANHVLRLALILDPVNPKTQMTLIEGLIDARLFDEALRLLQERRRTDPTSVSTASSLAEVLFALGRTSEISSVCNDSNVGFDELGKVWCEALAHIGMNRQTEAKTAVRRFAAMSGLRFPYSIARLEALLHNRAAALRMLSMAERKSDVMIAWLRTDWQLDSLRDEPQFKAIEARLHFAEADRYLK